MEDKKWKLRRERMRRAHALLEGKVPNRVFFLMGRAYLWGMLEKPLEELTDEEILAVQFVGPTTVFAIRAVIPAPGS